MPNHTTDRDGGCLAPPAGGPALHFAVSAAPRRLLPLVCALVLFCVGCAGMVRPAAAQPLPNGSAAATASGAAPAELPREVLDYLELLTGPNTLRARQFGARHLMALQDPAAIAALRQVLIAKPAPAVVQAVAQAVLEIREPPVELVDPLIASLQIDQPEVRSAVVVALNAYRNYGIAARLQAVAADAAAPQPQRLAAIAVLANLADRDAIETLIRLLELPDEPLRATALASLNKVTGASFGPDPAQWDRWWKDNRDRRPTEWLAERNAALVQENRILSEHVKGLRARLVDALRNAYHAAPEAERPRRITDYLADLESDVRRLGIDLVNDLITERKPVPDEVAAHLRTMIQDPEPIVRLETVQVLRDLRRSDDARILLDALGRETDPAVSQSILKALGYLGDPAAVPVLLEWLNKPDEALAAAAAAGIGPLCQRTNGATAAPCDDSVITALIARHQSAEGRDLRQATLEAMQRIGDKRFRQPLTAALSSQDPAFRQLAARAFESLADPEDAEKLIVPLLADAEPTVRETACRVLGRIGRPAQLPLLLRRADSQAEADVAVRRAGRDAAVAILLRSDAGTLATALQELGALPGHVAALADVLEAAMAQAAGRGADPRIQDVLLRHLAPAKEAAGQREAAAALWAQIVTRQPTPAAAASLARILLEIANPDLVSGTIGQIAGSQSGALVEVINALTREVQARRSAAGPGLAIDPYLQGLAKLDTAGWPEEGRRALEAFLASQAQAPATRPAGASQEAAPPATATAPATAPATPEPAVASSPASAPATQSSGVVVQK